MKKFKYICRVVLLISTFLYFGFFVMAIESLTENNPQAAFISLLILLILIVICKYAFKDEDLDNYKPSNWKYYGDL